MALGWKKVGEEDWVTSDGLGWIQDYCEPDSPYFAMWWRSSALHRWMEVKTTTNRRTYRRTLHAAKIEVERTLANLKQEAAA